MELIEPQFPDPELWIPNLRTLSDVGEGLMMVARGALRTFARDERYTRRVVTHGLTAAATPGQAAQLTVVFLRIFNGRAGEEQFQYVKGEPGKLAYHTAQFVVELSVPWPSMVQAGGGQPLLTASPEFEQARDNLWSDAYVVYAGLCALALGGIGLPWGGHVRSDPVAVGPMQAREPAGTIAAMYSSVHVELPSGG